jgi:hypothetical protein
MEKPVDKDDDGPDCVRYSIATSLPFDKPSGTIVFKDFDFRKLESRRHSNQDVETIHSENEMRAYYE